MGCNELNAETVLLSVMGVTGVTNNCVVYVCIYIQNRLVT